MSNDKMCYVCRKEEAQWCSYAKDKNGIDMGFCENCKVKWIKFAEKYGIKFGYHPNTFGVIDGHNACPKNASHKEIIRLWNIFIQTKCEEVVRFT